MRQRIDFSAMGWQVWLAAVAVVAAAVIVAFGAALGGYWVGDTRRAEAVAAESAEKVYTHDDLVAAVESCRADPKAVDGDTVTMPGGDFAAPSRQCVVEELDAPTIARREYTNTGGSEQPLEGGEYTWSNLKMTWKQTDHGRDLTISIKET